MCFCLKALSRTCVIRNKLYFFSRVLSININVIVVQVTSTDRDSAEFSMNKYMIEDDSGTFSIDADTGVVIVSKELDREKQSQ